MDNPLGEVLKRLRKQHRYTQVQIARELGIARTTYTGYELGTITPPMDKITSIMDIYKMGIKEFNRMVERETEIIKRDILYVQSGLGSIELYEVKNTMMRLLNQDITCMGQTIDRDEFIGPLKKVVMTYLDSIELKLTRSQVEYQYFKDMRDELKMTTDDYRLTTDEK